MTTQLSAPVLTGRQAAVPHPLDPLSPEEIRAAAIVLGKEKNLASSARFVMISLQEPPKPLPTSPRALFVGVLERYKNVDGLAEAWRRAAPRVPGSQLHVVGSGTLRPVVEQLVEDLPARTSWTERLTPSEVAAALDESTLLVLPSRSEGMGRVIVEAFCRARPVVATRVGGIPDLVQDESNGLLVEPGDTDGLADALVRVLDGRELAERLGAGAHSSAALWTVSPEDFASRLRDLVGRIAGLS